MTRAVWMSKQMTVYIHSIDTTQDGENAYIVSKQPGSHMTFRVIATDIMMEA